MTDIINHEDILVLVKQQMKKKGRKPKAEEEKLWDNKEYKRNYFNNYYATKRKEVLKNKPIEMVKCECGKEYNSQWKSQHCRTKHHIVYMEIKNNLEKKV